MRAFAIILNLLCPGLGSVILGRFGAAAGQALLFWFAVAFTIGTFLYGIVLGLPLMIVAWVWGVRTALAAGR